MNTQDLRIDYHNHKVRDDSNSMKVGKGKVLASVQELYLKIFYRISYPIISKVVYIYWTQVYRIIYTKVIW